MVTGVETDQGQIKCGRCELYRYVGADLGLRNDIDILMP